MPALTQSLNTGSRCQEAACNRRESCIDLAPVRTNRSMAAHVPAEDQRIGEVEPALGHSSDEMTLSDRAERGDRRLRRTRLLPIRPDASAVLCAYGRSGTAHDGGEKVP